MLIVFSYDLTKIPKMCRRHFVRARFVPDNNQDQLTQSEFFYLTREVYNRHTGSLCLCFFIRECLHFAIRSKWNVHREYVRS